jgi:predicted transcriptional regulator
MTQAAMAEDLDVSPSYIALMERNQRPVTADMLLRLAKTYAVDIGEFAADGASDLSDRLASILRDPLFSNLDFAASEATDVATGYPAFADAMLRLHGAYRESELALAERSKQAPAGPDPVAEARRFLGARKNFFPAIDDQAERLIEGPRNRQTLTEHLRERFGFSIRRMPASVMAGAVRRLDHHRSELLLDERMDGATQTFQIALQLAYLQTGDAIEAALSEGSFASENGRRLAKRALANYAAGAIIMPYSSFLKGAEELRYDLESLSRRFGASFEQTAHRLTTLQKEGQKGVPFFFIRVDAAGNVSKRLDGAGFPFARHGGSCPLWSVHQAFKMPRRIIPEWLELPGGERFFSVSRTVTAGGGSFNAPRVERAIALTCTAEHAGKLVYSDDPGLSPLRATPIGVACRLCHRTTCEARAEPPIGRPIADDSFRRPNAPFGFTDE